MRRPLEPGEPGLTVVEEETSILGRVLALAARRAAEPIDGGGPTRQDYEQELIRLRDQLAEERLEDHPMLIQQMTHVQALASRSRERALPIEVASPYFAHLRLRTAPKAGAGETRDSDVL